MKLRLFGINNSSMEGKMGGVKDFQKLRGQTVAWTSSVYSKNNYVSRVEKGRLIQSPKSSINEEK